MTIELTRDEAERLRELLQRKIEELDREINRTDSLAYKRELQAADRTVERILGRLTAALAHEPPAA